MNFRKITLKDGGTYEIAKDDKSYVLKQGENKIWISMSMVDYMSEQKDLEDSKNGAQ